MSAGIITPVDYKLFGRVGKVEIWENGQKSDRFQLDGLDFQFQTSQLFSAKSISTPANATVKILGLQQASVDYLCQFVSETFYMKRKLSVRVLAGYETNPNGIQELFNMPIVRAVPSAMPDNWVTLTANTNWGSENLQSYATTPTEDDGTVTAYKMMVDVAYAFQNITWIWRGTAEAVTKEKKVTPVEVTGGQAEAIKAIREKCPFLRITQIPSVSKGTYHYEVFSEEEVKGSSSSGGNTWVINSATGMIGVPTWAGVGEDGREAHVKTLLNPAYRPQDRVNLSSEIAKDLSRDGYKIITVDHQGHLRGNEWYSNIVMQYGTMK